jgi:hypothetical protein
VRAALSWGHAVIDHDEPVQKADTPDDGSQPASGSQLAQLYADLQFLMFCDQFGDSTAGPELDAVLGRLATHAPILKRLAGGLNEDDLQSVLSDKLSDGPVADRLRGMAQADGSLAAMLQRRAERFEQVIAGRRNPAAVTFSDEPITSDDACVLAAAGVLIGSVGGPIMLAITLYQASQVC